MSWEGPNGKCRDSRCRYLRPHGGSASQAAAEGATRGDRGVSERRLELDTLEHLGGTRRMTYDFLVNATGPKLNFAATPGPGPDGNSLSVCTPPHAEQTVPSRQSRVAVVQVIARNDVR